MEAIDEVEADGALAIYIAEIERYCEAVEALR